MLLFNVNTTGSKYQGFRNDQKPKDFPTGNMNFSNVNNQLRIQGLTNQIISSIHVFDYSDLLKPPFVVSWSPTLIR